jgi:hypothetical protein
MLLTENWENVIKHGTVNIKIKMLDLWKDRLVYLWH